MDTLETIRKRLTGTIVESTLEIKPWNNGGLKIQTDGVEEVAGIFSELADIIYNFGIEDLNIWTDMDNFTVYINLVDTEE